MSKKPDQSENKFIQFDPGGLPEIWEAFYPKIYRYIAYRVSRKEEAEDLTSEVFLRLMASHQDSKKNVQGWLYRTAENLMTDHYRRRAVRKDSQEATDLLDSYSDTKSDASKGLDAYDLQRGMKMLTGEQYQVILLKFIEGYSTKEIAPIMGKSEGAVKALQFRALQTLRDFFVQDKQDE